MCEERGEARILGAILPRPLFVLVLCGWLAPARVPGGADVFVGYGGVQVREAVEKGADWFVTDFDAFIDVVKSKR